MSVVGGNFGNKIPKLMPPRVTSTVSLRFRERSRPVSLCCIAVLILVIIGKILSTRLGKKERKKKRNPIFRLMNSGFFAEDEINDFFFDADNLIMERKSYRRCRISFLKPASETLVFGGDSISGMGEIDRVCAARSREKS